MCFTLIYDLEYSLLDLKKNVTVNELKWRWEQRAFAQKTRFPKLNSIEWRQYSSKEEFFFFFFIVLWHFLRHQRLYIFQFVSDQQDSVVI